MLASGAADGECGEPLALSDIANRYDLHQVLHGCQECVGAGLPEQPATSKAAKVGRSSSFMNSGAVNWKASELLLIE